MNKTLSDGSLSTVISGSYRKHLAEIMALRDYLESQGVTVLSPVGTHAVNPGEEFVILDADPVKDERLLQDSIFAKLRRSTFLVAFNKDGYLGKAAVLEIGYAISQGVQILTIEDVEDPNIRPYTRKIADVFPDVPAYGARKVA